MDLYFLEANSLLHVLVYPGLKQALKSQGEVHSLKCYSTSVNVIFIMLEHYCCVRGACFDCPESDMESGLYTVSLKSSLNINTVVPLRKVCLRRAVHVSQWPASPGQQALGPLGLPPGPRRQLIRRRSRRRPGLVVRVRFHNLGTNIKLL